MPAVIPKHVLLRNGFRELVADAIALNELLEYIIAIKSWQASAGEFHGKVSHSPPPWNSGAADVIFELHAWARTAELEMRTALGLRARRRGGSSSNTRAALDNLVKLAEAASDGLVKEDRIWLNGWCRRAEIVLGTQEAAKRLPREQGEAEPVCPWCHRVTLRQFALRGEVFCCDPNCLDEDGQRPRARLEFFQGDWVLRWQDGVLS